MDKYEAKRWLYRGWNLNREINALLKAKSETYADLTTGIAGVRDTPGGSTSPHKFDRYALLSDLIDRRVDELVAIKTEILQAISKVKDSRYRTLLIDRYARFLMLEQIAEEMHYDFRHITRLHGEALEAFAETMTKNVL